MKYYKKGLAGKRLLKSYQLGSPRIQQFLQAEINHVIKKLRPSDHVLDLGCGYGRVALEIYAHAATITGVDTSQESLDLGLSMIKGKPINLLNMDAANLAFKDDSFEMVICVQNGISAFKVDQLQLINQAIRVCRPGGTVLFSSYSDKFWHERLKWFEQQANAELIGEIDYDKTVNGDIYCKDGFHATTVRPADFQRLASRLGLFPIIEEIDNSTIFCVLQIPI